jgi:pimeloyl-ACP methyl ester carboxylesterase
VLLMHGERDTLIPPSHSRAWRRCRRRPLLMVPGAGHNDLQQFPAYLDGLRAALDRL